jgi:hypothetical protein
MADDAGFAVAITIRQSLLNNAILTSYARGSFPHTLSTIDFSGGLPGGPPDANLDVFLAPPQITCKNDGTMTIAVEMWGSLTVTLAGTPEAGNVLANLVLQLKPQFTVKNTTQEKSLVLGFGDTVHDVTATEWDFTVISGTPFSNEADAYLRSDVFRNRMQTAIQDAISLQKVKLPSIDASFLGTGILSAVKGMVAQSRIVADALLLGLDIDTDTATGHVKTSGNVNELADFAQSNDIAAVTSAPAVPILLQQVQDEVSTQVSSSNASLDSLEITAQTGRFHVKGQASNWQGTAHFSFNITPQMYAYRPGILFQYLPEYVTVNPRQWPALAFTIGDVQVDADPATWLAVVAVVFSVVDPRVSYIIFSLASDNARYLSADISSAKTNTPMPRVQHLKSFVPGGPTVRIELADFQISTLGTYVGLRVQPKAPPGALMGPATIPSNYAAEPIGYTVRLPLGVMADDPNLRARWTVTDPQGNVLVSQDDKAAGRLTFTVTPQVDAPGVSELSVGVRVYRTLGAQISDLVNDDVTLNIRGPLPPGAYVRWFYEVKNPQVTFDDVNQIWAFKGDLRVKRHSNIHRTDQPCKNASKRSRYASQVDVLDALPFPLSEITFHRSELCDYCFFGGPGGIRPSL